jgi:hypothetical protein
MMNSMILLFRSGTYVPGLLSNPQCPRSCADMSPTSVREKAGLIFRATRTHARNLAKFATIYKLTCMLLKNFGATPGKEGKIYGSGDCGKFASLTLRPRPL